MNKVNQTQADKFGVTLAELQAAATGKSCSVYPNEVLAVRKGRKGGVTVLNISEKARAEKISTAKAAKSPVGNTAE